MMTAAQAIPSSITLENVFAISLGPSINGATDAVDVEIQCRLTDGTSVTGEVTLSSIAGDYAPRGSVECWMSGWMLAILRGRLRGRAYADALSTIASTAARAVVDDRPTIPRLPAFELPHGAEARVQNFVDGRAIQVDLRLRGGALISVWYGGDTVQVDCLGHGRWEDGHLVDCVGDLAYEGEVRDAVEDVLQALSDPETSELPDPASLPDDWRRS